MQDLSAGEIGDTSSSSLFLCTCLLALLPSIFSAIADTGSRPSAIGGLYYSTPTFFAMCLQKFLFDLGGLSLLIPACPSPPHPPHLLKGFTFPTCWFMGWLVPFPVTCLLSSMGSCYFSCVGYVCDFPVPAQHGLHLTSFLSHAEETLLLNLLVTSPS